MSKKRKPSLSNREFDILGTLKVLNTSKVNPDKARIFNECAEADDSYRDEYYSTIDDLVARNMIDEHLEYYGSAVPWRRYKITRSATTLLKNI